MSHETRSRCEIYKKIDALDGARTVADLVEQLKPILSELAYYAVTGEAAVMEVHEDWRSQYSDALYSATAADFNAGRAQAALPPRAVAGRRAAIAGETSRAPETSRARGKGRGGDERRQLPPPANRPRPRDLPLSLRSIMDGTHSSFKEGDE